MAEQFELRLTYSAATIYVRKVVDNKVKKQDDPTTTSNPVELTESEDDYSANESSSSASTQVHDIISVPGLDIGLVGPVARGASRFENLLAPQKTYWPGGPVDLKTYWPPKKLTGPYLKTKLARRKTICINLQFAHRPIIKLFRSHPRKKIQI